MCRYSAEGVTVSCTNGQTFDADAVVVTVSIGVLQVRWPPQPLIPHLLPHISHSTAIHISFELLKYMKQLHR